MLRARRHLLGLYLLLGMTIASWLSRLPSVRASLDLTTGELGRILLLGAISSLVTVLSAGGLATRWGSRKTLTVAAVVYAAAAAVFGLGPALGSVPLLVLGVMAQSASFGLGNVPLNVESMAIERRMGRTVVPQFHAAFSVGSVVGSGLGVLAAWGDVPLAVHLGSISVLSLVWRLRSIPVAVLETAPGRTTGPDAPPAGRRGGFRHALGAWRERRTLLIGLVVMSAALSEGSANNWVALAVVDGFGQTETIAAAVFATFVAAMTVARLLGTWLIDRFGRVAVLAASGVVSLCGLGIFGLSPSLPLAVLGVVCWGLGAGLAVPIGMAAASGDPLRAAARVSVVSAFASVAALSAPPLIGLLAESVGTRHALLFIGLAMVVSICLAGVVRPEDEGARVPGAARCSGGRTGAGADESAIGSGHDLGEREREAAEGLLDDHPDGPLDDQPDRRRQPVLSGPAR